MAKKKQPTEETPYWETEEYKASQEIHRKAEEQEKLRRQGGGDFKPYRYVEIRPNSKNLGPDPRAAYDSRLILRGGENAELTLILRVHFQRVDPTPRGGSQRVVKDGRDREFAVTEITDQEMDVFRFKARYQANETWRGLSLVTPNDFIGFDWPKENPTVRPNVNCSLQFELAPPSAAHATVRLVKPARPGDFRSFVDLDKGTSTWDITDILWREGIAIQDRGDPKEPIWQHMVPHEVGHLLGLQHISLTMDAASCTSRPNPCLKEVADFQEYGEDASFPMWWARDIMGVGGVVHACNLTPWAYAMAAHTSHITTAGRWIPAGVQIDPRPIKDIPKERWTWKNSPYTGGFQEQGKYR